jgi:hypothetical protein
MAYRYNPFTNNFDDVGVGGNGSVVLSAGTVSSPSLTFTGDSNTGIYSPGADNLAITTSGTERLRVISTGEIVAGGTSAVGGTVLTLQENGTLSGALAIKNRNSTQRWKIGVDATVVDDKKFIIVNDNTATIPFMLTDTGNVGIGLTSPTYQLQLSTDSAGKPSTALWTITSDERIKEDIELADLDLCYEAIKTIPLKRYKWRDDVYSEEQVTDRRKLGWIAQDVETVFPKAVNTHEFKYNQVYETVTVPEILEELDDEGNVIKEAVPEHTKQELISEETIPDCKDLNADQIYAAMYGAIQKLIIKFEVFEERLDAAGIK